IMYGMVGKQNPYSICYLWQFCPRVYGTAPLADSLHSTKGDTHRRRSYLKICQSSVVVQSSA
ncbi:hypothetical protein SK128_005244, partial [Halocaridina rubra]